MVVGQAAPWFREACAIVDLVGLGYVLPCDWRTCVPSSSLLLIVYTNLCICLTTRMALCICCFLSTSFVVVWRCYLKDGAEPSQALPDHVVLDVVVARGFVGAVVGPCFVYVSRSGRLDLLAIDWSACCGALQRASLWWCSSRQHFFKVCFFEMCVSITVSDSDRGG